MNEANGNLGTPSTFVFDLDGVFTDGQFYYSVEGKVMKAFGADDHDALLLVQRFLQVHVVTSDARGFEISKKRIHEDLGIPIYLVPSRGREKWIRERFDALRCIYMGDGIFDPLVFREVLYSICPSNALPATRLAADYVTQCSGGNRAVAEACLHVLEKFFEPFNH